jgi:hypothetical protein
MTERTRRRTIGSFLQDLVRRPRPYPSPVALDSNLGAAANQTLLPDTTAALGVGRPSGRLSPLLTSTPGPPSRPRSAAGIAAPDEQGWRLLIVIHFVFP